MHELCIVWIVYCELTQPKNSTGGLLAVLIFFNVSHNDMQKSNIFYRFRNVRILPKNLWLKSNSMKTKNYVRNYARYAMLKNYFL